MRQRDIYIKFSEPVWNSMNLKSLEPQTVNIRNDNLNIILIFPKIESFVTGSNVNPISCVLNMYV